MPKKKQLTFEEALGNLEDIVIELEDGDTNLSELITKYSEGVQLANFCLQSLKRAEETMDLLIKATDKGIVEVKLEI